VWDKLPFIKKVWEKVWVSRLEDDMKQRIFELTLILTAALGLSGCSGIGERSASLSVIYFAAAILSLLLLTVYLFGVRRRTVWFVLLFSSVLVVNVGYAWLSVSSGLEAALMANRVAYLGSVFLPLSMLMIILDFTKTKYKKWLAWTLLALCLPVFLIVASPGILDIYYKEVSFAVVDGVSTLVKVYGVLHPLYLVYLLGYFIAMVALVIRTFVKRMLGETAHAVLIAIAVFVNVGVWFIEQICPIDFEFLSISYIITELFLLGVHLFENENRKLRELLKQKDEAIVASRAAEKAAPSGEISQEKIECFNAGIATLTPTERAIFEAYLRGAPTKEIMSTLNIKENTLKFHNKNLYGKLGVSSRKELIEISKRADN